MEAHLCRGSASAGLLNYFERRHIAVSADLGMCKPNPAIFLHVLNALDVSPQETAMVGDRLVRILPEPEILISLPSGNRNYGSQEGSRGTDC